MKFKFHILEMKLEFILKCLWVDIGAQKFTDNLRVCTSCLGVIGQLDIVDGVMGRVRSVYISAKPKSNTLQNMNYRIRGVRSPNFEIPVQIPKIKSFGFYVPTVFFASLSHACSLPTAM